MLELLFCGHKILYTLYGIKLSNNVKNNSIVLQISKLIENKVIKYVILYNYKFVVRLMFKITPHADVENYFIK